MAVYEGVYKSLLQGVSQQTPQEREDGQLGEQINMLSDPVTGLRRRGGVKFGAYLPTMKPHWYIEVINHLGALLTVIIDVDTGTLYTFNGLTDSALHGRFIEPYFKTTKGKGSIKTTIVNNKLYILNTERVPKLQKYLTDPIPSWRKDPRHYGYYSVRATQFSKKYTLTVTLGSYTGSWSGYTSDSVANQATPDYIAKRFYDAFAGGLAPELTALVDISRLGSTLAFRVKDKTSTDTLSVESGESSGYVLASGNSRVNSRTELLGVLPPALDGYIMAVGVLSNTAYYKYQHSTKTWSESSTYDDVLGYFNVPMVYTISTDPTEVQLAPMAMSPRKAGDDNNNPYPQFVDYGLTGISSYQSRLVLLSGAYVHLSKSGDYGQFLRTTVTELLDDDAIEMSSAVLASAQYEYAIPYNRDLVLISQKHQAVIPANSTVLTPKTAVIYPSTELDISLAVKPTVVSKTMYYTYQRGAAYYQVGEFIPNTYNEGQYYAQNLTDHLPLYASGVCTSMAASTTNNMAVFASGTREVLINQFMWRGEERPIMSFHKWVLPYKVVHVHFEGEFLILFMATGTGGLYIGTVNIQLNQLDDKPVPYLDMYRYVDIDASGQGDLRAIELASKAVIYDARNQRHKEVAFKQSVDYIYDCPYVGTISVGVPFESTFTLTPPFLKDESGKVVAGTRTTIQQLRMTFKSTGSFNVKVLDTMGTAYDSEGDTALTWSEADLGYSWVNSIGAVVIPCRTRLASTECSVTTTGTTDMNLVSTEYILRTANKRRRL